LPIASAALIERFTSAARPPTVVTPASAPPRGADAGPHQLGLAAQVLEAALEALLPALADRDQLRLDLAAFDRKPDGVGLGASGHD